MVLKIAKRAAARLLSLGFAIAALAAHPSAQEACGEVLTLKTHGSSTTALSIAMPPPSAAEDRRMALVLLPGGPGYMALASKGCARKLEGNSLVRSVKLFNAAGFVTALVDAPSDHRGQDGLGGFRLSSQHAYDIGKVIAEVRARTKLPVWLVGTSRGAISAANAATRLTGPAAPDGLVLTSPVTSGRVGGYKAWVAQTVLSTRLEAIRMPVLVVVHAADKCIRTPPALASRILARTKGEREQLVSVTGGSVKRGAVSVEACRGKTAHGFVGQEEQVAAGIARFVRGGRY